MFGLRKTGFCKKLQLAKKHTRNLSNKKVKIQVSSVDSDVDMKDTIANLRSHL